MPLPSFSLTRRWLRPACALGAVAVLGCAPARQRVYVAPSLDTVITSLEQGRTDPPSQIIWVENRSTVPVTVYSVALRDCQNVRQVCEPRPVDVTLAGGQKRVVMRIEPRSANQGFSFRYSFAWRPAEASAQ